MSENLFCLYAFGRVSSLNQAVYCLLTLESIYRNSTFKMPKVLIYTDNVNHFKLNLSAAFNFEYINLDPAMLSDWKGQPPDNFRIKLKSLEHACQNFKNSNVILVDSDTFIKKELTEMFNKIEQGFIYFHADEGKMNENKTVGQRNLTQHFQDKEYYIDGKKFSFPPALHLYNAGLIGISSNKIQQVQDAIKLHDSIFEPYRLYFAEQLSIIFELQKTNTVLTAEPFVAHYWYIKEFDELITSILLKIARNKTRDFSAEILELRKSVPSMEKFKSIGFKFAWKIKNKLIKLGLLHKKFRWN